jgi:hypothetical protein
MLYRRASFDKRLQELGTAILYPAIQMENQSLRRFPVLAHHRQRIADAARRKVVGK